MNIEQTNEDNILHNYCLYNYVFEFSFSFTTIIVVNSSIFRKLTFNNVNFETETWSTSCVKYKAITDYKSLLGFLQLPVNDIHWKTIIQLKMQTGLSNMNSMIRHY